MIVALMHAPHLLHAGLAVPPLLVSDVSSLQNGSKVNLPVDSCVDDAAHHSHLHGGHEPLPDNDDCNGSPQGRQPQNSSCAKPPLRSYHQSACNENRTLQTLCEQGRLVEAVDALMRMDKSASTNAYLSLLKLCTKTKSITHVKDVCAHLIQHRPEPRGFLGDFLVVALAKCGAVEDARKIADRLVCRTVFSWTALISAYVDRGQELESLRMYECMRKEGVLADTFTFVSLLKACIHLNDLAWGKIIHADARKQGLATENFVGNSLVTMYGKCGDILDAESAFLNLSYRDIVSWTAMLSAYLEQSQSKKALLVFRQMQEEGIIPNRLTFVIALQACVSFADAGDINGESVKSISLEVGQMLHASARRKGLAADSFVGTTLLSMYGNCGSINMAEHVFSMLLQKSIVPCNAMLAAYIDQKLGYRALLLFKNLINEGITPDHLTYVSAIQACSILAEEEATTATDGFSRKVLALKIGQALHVDACMEDLDYSFVLNTALVTMYGKCGCIQEAEAVFHDMSSHDIVSWTAMFYVYVEQRHGKKALHFHREMQEHQILLDNTSLMLSWTAMLSGYIGEGQGERALELYRLMRKEGVMLDDVALKCVLQACCLTGSLIECRKVHSRIVCLGYDMSESVVATLIHAYGNCGSMVDAQVIFDCLSEPDIVSWSACIAGHAGEGDLSACVCMFEKLILADLLPDELTYTSILLVCCHAGSVARGLEFLESMCMDFSVAPDLKHYGIVLDLLGRAGDLNRVVELLGCMHLQVDFAMCMCLLGACQTHGNVELARVAFDYATVLQPKDATAYIMMSNIYAKAGMHECVVEIEASRQKACVKGKSIEEE